MGNSSDHLREHQWKPGQSGNPGGRPKGSVDIWGRIRRELLRQSADGREVADLIARLVVREAMKGDWKMLRELLRYEEPEADPAGAAGQMADDICHAVQAMLESQGITDIGEAVDDGRDDDGDGTADDSGVADAGGRNAESPGEGRE